MAEVILQTRPRERGTHGNTKRMRQLGMIPAVLYGGKGAPLSIALDSKELFSALKGRVRESTVLDLELQEGTRDKALIREIQIDPISDKIIHIDFQRILMTEKVTLSVMVETVGEPVGVKSDGGIMEHLVREIEIRCLPGDIPSRVELDVSQLKIGDSLHVSDLVFPNVEILSSPETPIVTVLPPEAAEKVAAPAEEVAAVAAEETPAEPELVKKKKEAAPETEKESEKEKK